MIAVKILFLALISFCLNLSADVIVIDAGATNTRFGLWNSSTLSDIIRVKSPHCQDPAHKDLNIQELQNLWLTMLNENIEAYKQHYENIQSVAICFPGYVDNAGTIVRSSNLWGAAVNPISRATLEQKFKLPVCTSNDVVTALYRYVADEQYAKHSRIALLTVSSGIAIKLYDRNAQRVIVDDKGRGGSIGHVVADHSPNAVEDPVLKGKLECYTSGRGIINVARRLAEQAEFQATFQKSSLYKALQDANHSLKSVQSDQFNELLVQAVKQNDACAQDILRSSISYLANVLSPYIIATAPDVIILMGGVVEAFGEIYRTMLVQELKVFGYSNDEVNEMIKCGIADDMNGLIGAGHMADMLAHDKQS